MSLTAVIFICASALSTGERACDVLVYRDMPGPVEFCAATTERSANSMAAEMLENSNNKDVDRYSECGEAKVMADGIGNTEGLEEILSEQFGADVYRIRQFELIPGTESFRIYVPGIRL
jgi:hypothetical protein